ncbi:MAG: OmpA family protein [Treponema sp.]|jgi:outer membrane protein OmpA-like peptidoglycan-associated protein/flagellar hook assembly protein FlgD|nr:OmpA family protein [Treponema sp.]
MKKLSVFMAVFLCFILGIYGQSRNWVGSSESEADKAAISAEMALMMPNQAMRFIDAESGKPIAGAVVEIPGAGSFTTNAKGIITFRVSNGNRTLSFSKEGYGKVPVDFIVMIGMLRFARPADQLYPNWVLIAPYRDTTPPNAVVRLEYPVFSPNNDGNLDELIIYQEGSAETLWTGAVYHTESSQPIRSFRFTGMPASRIAWDGRNDDGALSPDGQYAYYLSSTDEAGNTGISNTLNFTLTTIETPISLRGAPQSFSPNDDGVADTITMIPQIRLLDGIAGWKVEIFPAVGSQPVYTIEGRGPPPESVPWDGKDKGGTIVQDGSYTGQLEVYYTMGNRPQTRSAPFTVDNTHPRASIRFEYDIFSPNRDGNRDELIIYQEGTTEETWIGEIRRASDPPTAAPLQSFNFTGVPASELRWNGMTSAGTLAADGVYSYTLRGKDAAGNIGVSAALNFTLSTADTSIQVSTDSRAFSPNDDGVADTITMIPQIRVREGISGWKVEILPALGSLPVRIIEGRGLPPQSVPWDGRNTAGITAPDGNYTARLSLSYIQGNQPSAVSIPFDLDTQAPRAEISAAYTLFSPNGDNRRDTLPINVITEGNDEWTAAITDAQGTLIRSWQWTGRSASNPLSWDGLNQNGVKVPDGIYSFKLSSTDIAGNTAQRILSNLAVDTRIPRVSLNSSASTIAPKARQTADSVRFNISLSLPDGIATWRFEIRDESNRIVRSFSHLTGHGTAPPASIGWNGLDEQGNVREGRYNPSITVSYTKGDEVSAAAAFVLVDIRGPELSFSSRPEFFSPDNDGSDDILNINLGVQDASPIASWSLDIKEPQAPFPVFYRFSGQGAPPSSLTWNGFSSKGELVQSAMDYPCTLSVEDVHGNGSSVNAIIGVDILVIRKGERLYIQVPAITFRPNGADFNTLSTDVVDTNNRVLKRIAEILNKFSDYKVQVEGHANATARTAAAREEEERKELQPLSEQRAKYIMERLGALGVAGSRLSYVGMGGRRPAVDISDNNRHEAWKNRRVEFVLIK